jgi:hypothetical protein
MSENKRPNILLIAALIVVIVLALFTCSDYISQTHAYVEGSGEELITNIVNRCDGGSRLIVIDRVGNSELNHIVDCVYDNPNLFWVDTRYNALSIGKFSIIFLSEKYNDIDVKRIEIEEKSNAILAGLLTDNMNEYEKTLAIHDWICNNVKYKKTDNDSDQDIYGAIVLGEARCAGYAEAFAYLLNKAGIKAEVISGAAIDQMGQSISHAWNLVYIDDEPYYFDITWNDDNKEKPSYWWFGVTSKEFQLSHFPSDGYKWVEATAIEANYFVHNKMYLKKYNATELIRHAAKQGLEFYVKCADSMVFDKTVMALSNRNEMCKIMRGLGLQSIDKITYIENPSTNGLYIKIITQTASVDTIF